MRPYPSPGDSRRRVPPAEVSVRALLLLLGLAGAIWPAATLPTFRSLSTAREMTNRIIVDDRFKPSTLANMQAQLDAQAAPPLQHPDLARAKALVAVRASEEMARDSAMAVDLLVEDAEYRVRSMLAQSPADSFLWQVLYSVVTSRGGFDESNIPFLERSYTTGPLEGWIALRRSRLALASFPMLGERLRDRVVAEFAGLVNSDLTDAAVSTLESVGWSQKDRLLAGLGAVDIQSKERLSRRLSADGVRVKIPGIEFDERPWR